jgi:hypothetical protein
MDANTGRNQISIAGLTGGSRKNPGLCIDRITRLPYCCRVSQISEICSSLSAGRALGGLQTAYLTAGDR